MGQYFPDLLHTSHRFPSFPWQQHFALVIPALDLISTAFLGFPTGLEDVNPRRHLPGLAAASG